MSKKRIFLSFVFPPFAVVDKGCGQYLLTFILTCLGWVPGIICALVILKLEQRKNRNKKDDTKKQIEKLQHKQSRDNSLRANKLQSRIASRNKKSGVNSSLSDMQSPFNRKRRMNNNDNSNSQGWQRW